MDENRRVLAAFAWWSDLNYICHNSGEESWFKSRIKWSVGSGSKARFLGRWVDG